MRILVSGTSGLVGTSLVEFLESSGHEVFKLVRQSEKSTKEIYWRIPEFTGGFGEVDTARLEGFNAVIHLAGENIAGKRWTKKQKQKIYDSRVLSTKFLVSELIKLNQPPQILICASAIGFYGHSEALHFTENSAHGHGFLANTCLDWENASKEAKTRDIRIVNARFGVILDTKSGALAKMLPIFKLGAGGILGNGRQWMSWITLADINLAIKHCLEHENLSGAVNFVSPEPVTNKEFTHVLAKVLRRPAIFPVPAIILDLALGEMAEALLLSSAKVDPKVLRNSGFNFQYPSLEDALRAVLT